MLEILFASTPPIPAHAIVAFVATGLGAVQMMMPKGTTSHRWLGYGWCGLMAFVAVSGFFIHTIKIIGIFSPIHFLSVAVLITLWKAIAFARRGNIARHRRMMMILFWVALIFTGALTFIPGRLMFQVVAGG